MARSAFLTPEFDPTTFLSSLENRHQTLEDLRTELRTRSQELSKELLDLVNVNYQDFLSLGSSLKGGEDRVEEIRLALLGLRRDVGGMRSKFEGRQVEVADLIRRRRDYRKEIQLGRTLLELDEGLQSLEQTLMLEQDLGTQSNGLIGSEPFISINEDDEHEGDPDDDPVISKLERCTEQHAVIRQVLRSIREDHPLKADMNRRLAKVKEALLLDLANVMKQMNEARANTNGLLDLAMLRSNVIDSDQLSTAVGKE